MGARCLILVVLSALIAFGCAASSQGTEPDLALVGGTIYTSPDAPPITNGIVLIRGSKIEAVGPHDVISLRPKTRTIDCTGLTITAGFWNSHVHFLEKQWADAGAIPKDRLARQLKDTYGRYGFTSVFDLGSPWDNTRVIRDRIESGEVQGPRVRSTGEVLIVPNAMPGRDVLDRMGFMAFPTPEVAGETEARLAARELLDAGVDGVKVHLQRSPSGQAFPESAIAVAAVEAQARGKPLFVHPNTRADVLAAVEAGADVIAHTTPRTGRWDAALLRAMKEADVALTPTLMLWQARQPADELTPAAINQLQSWVGAGGAVLFGTDIGAVGPDPTSEYELMAEAGMSFQQILASLTTEPAARFGEAEVSGRISPGLAADVIIFRGEPTSDIRALADVQHTFRAGAQIYVAPD